MGSRVRLILKFNAAGPFMTRHVLNNIYAVISGKHLLLNVLFLKNAKSRTQSSKVLGLVASMSLICLKKEKANNIFLLTLCKTDQRSFYEAIQRNSFKQTFFDETNESNDDDDDDYEDDDNVDDDDDDNYVYQNQHIIGVKS
ncbi:hypothetical protein HELRODRAFT_167858 [Helobdella robusta]|uniref:Uncharacterized protein n=1 Tax=Helobdella robusta TaxID=6412 RepID=T1EZW0_HELRO|nr:hypothetical protein HELRODRAFT_167858 [Helobdella robusta]ESO10021.1 hypothetical protein HELRODRAFT_167858 [Helobdella robusta]